MTKAQNSENPNPHTHTLTNSVCVCVWIRIFATSGVSETPDVESITFLIRV